MPPVEQRPCVEPGCDRPSTEGDERCELHQQRLGARPSGPSRPSSPPRPASHPVIVETALDASVAIPPPRKATRRELRLALGGWLLGSAGFWGSLALSFRWTLRGAAEVAFLALVYACGALATYGAFWYARKTPSKVLGALVAVASFGTAVPVLVATVGVLAWLLGIMVSH